jgi:ferric-dicitrate binding protein FerR (iron transport regulator)
MRTRSTLTWTTRTLLLATALVVSIAPLAAQDSSAKVIYQVGQVSTASGGYFTTLSVGQKVNARQLIVTGSDGYARFEVSDGSTFEVFPNSKVVFRETPGNWQHLINIVMGRVKVFIQHAPGVPNPNQVTSPTAVISVRGTVFDVVVQDDDGTTFVTVDEGTVWVKNETAAGNVAILNAGDSITVYRGQPLFAKQIDKGGFLRQVLYAARNVILSHPPIGGPGGGPVGSVPGAQGDKPKPGGTTTGGPTAPTNAPGAPPAVPGAPPNGPGGGL